MDLDRKELLGVIVYAAVHVAVLLAAAAGVTALVVTCRAAIGIG